MIDLARLATTHYPNTLRTADDSTSNEITYLRRHLLWMLEQEHVAAAFDLAHFRKRHNGRVERSHRIDQEEFRGRLKFDDFNEAATALLAWEITYNYGRFSLGLQGEGPQRRSSLASCRLRLRDGAGATDHH